ncbi:hypothetical protein DFH28DRAFT_888530 [Melampsora americana]|nr:hypothetical protein DFH28DRAFT_888530 [Melampsora americana]
MNGNYKSFFIGASEGVSSSDCTDILESLASPGSHDSQLFVPKDWSSATSKAYPDPKRPIQRITEKEYIVKLVRQLNLVNTLVHNAPMSAPLMRAWQAVACAIAKDGNDLAEKKFTNEPGALTWVDLSQDDSASADEEMESKFSNNRAISPTPTSSSASPRDHTPTTTQKNQALPELTKNTKPAKRYSQRSLMNKTLTEDTVASANLATIKKSNEPSLNKRTISQMTEPQANTQDSSKKSRPSAPTTSILRDDSPAPPAPVWGKDPEVQKLISSITVLATYPSALPVATWNNPLFVALLHRPALDLFHTSPLNPEDQAFNLKKFLENVLPDDKIEELLELGEYGLDSILEYIKHFRDQGIWTVSGDRLLIPTLNRIQEYLIASMRPPWLQPPPSPSKSPNCSQSPPPPTATNTSSDLPAASLSSASSTPELALPDGIKIVLDKINHLESLESIIPSQLTQITTTLSSKNLRPENISLWIDPDNHKIDIQCSSIQAKKETTEDCVLLYDACSRMLRARLSASMTTYDPLKRARGNEVLYFSKDFKLSQWVARDQTKNFFIAGCESPWGQDHVFNWNYIDLQSEKSPSENELEKRLCDSFRLMRHPTKHRLEMAGKFVLAAISLVGSEAGPLPPLHEFTEVDLPFVEVKDSFQCALHYQKLQSKAQHQSSRNETIEMTCLEKLTKLVDSIYGCIEALAVIRAHHHQQTQIRKFRNSQSDINASFHAAASAVALRSQALTPLVAFLSLGFKGLLTYRRDTNRSNKTDLIQLCLVTGRMSNVEFSDEPVWKRASNYVLESISKALFPKGDGEEVPLEWEHVTCRKYDLALAMYLDVSEHCRNSPVSDPKFPLYKLPVYDNLTPEESETCY